MTTKTMLKKQTMNWKWFARKTARTQIYAAVFGTVSSNIERKRGQRADAGQPWHNKLRVVIDGSDDQKTAYWLQTRRTVQELWKGAKLSPTAAREVLARLNKHLVEPLDLNELNKA